MNSLAVRDVQYPDIPHEGFSAGKFDQYKQYHEVKGGIDYEVIEFPVTVFATQPGQLKLGPGTLLCNLIVRKPDNPGEAISGTFLIIFSAGMIPIR